MSRIAYVNGRYVPQHEASVNVEDRGFQFADGVYEVIHIYAGRFVDEERHLARLERSLGEISVTPPMGRAALSRVLTEVVRRNRVREGLVYMQVTRGVARRDFPFPSDAIPATLVVTCRRTGKYPTDVTKWAIKTITHPDQRWARCDIKSTGMLAQVLAKQAAKAAGAQEAIMLDAAGRVTEGGSSTIWIVDAEGALRTRHLDRAILPGCTRGALLALIDEAGLAAEESSFSEDELKAAREVFITSATGFVKPVTAIDGHPVGDGKVGPITHRLFDLFARHVKSGTNVRA
jgi:D-alanine transaminase